MSNIKSVLLILVFLVLALIISTSLVGGYSNKIRDIMVVTIGASSILALYKPKIAFYLLLIATGYLDLVKRFLMLDSSASFTDVYYVLGYAPVTLFAICVGVVLKSIANGSMNWKYGRLILVATLMFGLIAVLTMAKSGLSSIGYVAQSASFVVLIFCVPMVFKTSEEILTLLKTIIVIFIPVAVYAIYQFYSGLSQFELDYLESGFTSEVRHLLRGSGGEVYRLNFSTLNSTVAVSAIMCILAYTLLPAVGQFRGKRLKPLLDGIMGFKGVLIFILFAYAAFTTYTRAGWFGGIVCIAAWLLISNKKTTVLLYVLATLMVSILFIFPYEIESEFKEGVFGQGDSAEDELILTTSTWQARLLGFKNLHDDSSLWTPFGIEASGISMREEDWGLMSHDIITNSLMKYGYVVSSVFLVLMAIALYKLHYTYFRMSEGPSKRLLLLLLGGIIGNLSAGLTNQSALTVYPLNFYLWFFIGACFTVLFENGEIKKSQLQGSV